MRKCTPERATYCSRPPCTPSLGLILAPRAPRKHCASAAIPPPATNLRTPRTPSISRKRCASAATTLAYCYNMLLLPPAWPQLSGLSAALGCTPTPECTGRQRYTSMRPVSQAWPRQSPLLGTRSARSTPHRRWTSGGSPRWPRHGRAPLPEQGGEGRCHGRGQAGRDEAPGQVRT